jgi:hypothetical protein
MHTGLGRLPGIGLPLGHPEYTVKIIIQTGRGRVCLRGIQAQMFEHAVALVVGKDKYAHSRVTSHDCGRTGRHDQSSVLKGATNAAKSGGRVVVCISCDCQGEDLTKIRPNKEGLNIPREPLFAPNSKVPASSRCTKS